MQIETVSLTFNEPMEGDTVSFALVSESSPVFCIFLLGALIENDLSQPSMISPATADVNMIRFSSLEVSPGLMTDQFVVRDFVQVT